MSRIKLEQHMAQAKMIFHSDKLGFWTHLSIFLYPCPSALWAHLPHVIQTNLAITACCLAQHANADNVYSASCSRFIIASFLNSSFTSLLYLPLPATYLRYVPPVDFSLHFFGFSPVDGHSFCHSLLVRYTIVLAMPMPSNAATCVQSA